MYKLLKDKLQDIDDLLPDTDFIAVFGTSHTSGYCERQGEKELPLDDFWAQRLSKHTGLPVVNLSLIGNNNTTMSHQLAEFLLLENSRHCVQVICETRVGEHVFTVTNDTIQDLMSLERKNFLPQLSNAFNMRDIENFDGLYKKFPLDTVHDLLELRVPVTLQNISKERQLKYLHKSHPEELDEIPNYAYKSIMEQVENYENHVRFTMKPFVEDYKSVKMMSNLCELRDIPFAWFCWDDNPLMDRSDINYDVIRRAFKLTSNIFQQEVSGLVGSAITHFKQTVDDTTEYRCDCGHWDERVHDFVAQRIGKTIDDQR